MEIIPALIPNNKTELETGARTIRTYSPNLHLDVNDGVFVPAVSWPCGQGQWEELESAVVLPGCEDMAVSVHLMVSDPERIGVLFARAGARSLSAHIESFQDASELREVFRAWKQSGVERVGVVLLMDTPLSSLGPISDCIDFVQVMSIAHIGFQKEPFVERVLDRIRDIRAQFPTLPIFVDGGVSIQNARALSDAGATTLVVGSAIVLAPDQKSAYEALKKAV